jgi:hypothetical protein
MQLQNQGATDDADPNIRTSSKHTGHLLPETRTSPGLSTSVTIRIRINHTKTGINDSHSSSSNGQSQELSEPHTPHTGQHSHTLHIILLPTPSIIPFHGILDLTQ